MPFALLLSPSAYDAERAFFRTGPPLVLRCLFSRSQMTPSFAAAARAAFLLAYLVVWTVAFGEISDVVVGAVLAE